MTPKRFTNRDNRSAASKFGQMIGDVFEIVVIRFIEQFIEAQYPEYRLWSAEEGRQKVTLEMIGGLSKQMDTVVGPKSSDDPVALLESKWLKDGRHHNDKGAWILQLREVRKKYPTIRGAAAIFAGYWTEGVGVMLMNEGGIKMVLVATDVEVYSTLQEPLNQFLGNQTFVLDPREIRNRYPRPWDLANCLINLEESDKLHTIAETWLGFEHANEDGSVSDGRERIRNAIDELLVPLPPNPLVRNFEIALQIDTGNTIYQHFDDVEEAIEFMQTYACNPQAILEKITPRKNSD